MIELRKQSPGALETASSLYFDRARSRPAVSSTGQMAAQAGVAPAPFRLTGGRTTVIPLSIECLRTATTAPKTELRSAKLVSAGRFALPVTPSRTEHVAATPRAVAPANGGRRGLVSCGDERTLSLEYSVHRRSGGLEGTCTLNPPADNGALC